MNVRLVLSTTMLLLACAERPPRADVPNPGVADAAPASASASVAIATPPAPDAGQPAAQVDAGPTRPARPSTPVVEARYVNLTVSRSVLAIDREGHGVFETEQVMFDDEREARFIEGTTTESSMKHLVDTLKRSRFCSIKAPDEEPLMWIEIRVDLEPTKCLIKMSPAAWRKRHPDVLRALHALERDVCSGSCPRSPQFD